ncbi:hypothetical protein MPDQ_007379 [Monascus purpureus]|uniref:Ubiquitin-like-conjugating enzyme ATG10 n=1 Tax=Monascus purpureus TaxID=5098 RepID=A0A507QSG9_MONPU|nr:hypothetical protein MPDQ_007379 [Monascus purpureus]
MADASSQGMLSAFPFLTEPEFDHACATFLDRVQALESLHASGWSSVRLEKQACGTVLKISRVIDSPTTLNREKATLEDTPESHKSQADAFEDDPEALARTADPDPYFQVEYDILLSPTYQVPVLYFVLRGSRAGPVGIETVYQYLVPDQYKNEVKSVGVLGGISMGYHPESGTPAFFAHPCNTADAMKHIAHGQDVHPELYLLLWLGL